MFKLDRTATLFTLTTFAASMIALFIGLSMGLPRPYWAMMTVYIVSQPLSGAVRSKAIYRLAGTAVGASFTVLVVPALANAPVLLCLTLALWVGGCLGVSILDRTPRSYLVMLAGYTAALIGFPAVAQPDGIFDLAVSRVEEIGLGILAASVMHSLVFPRAVGPVITARLSAWLAEGDAWALDLMQTSDEKDIAADRRHLAAAATDIHLLSVHLPFDTSHLRRKTYLVHALHQRMLLLIPVLSEIGDRLTALRQLGGPLHPEAAAALAAIGSWITAGSPYAEAEALRHSLDAAQKAVAGPGWQALLSENLLRRLTMLVTVLSEGHALLTTLKVPHVSLPVPLHTLVAHQPERPMHRDPGIALMSGIACCVAILINCALWIQTGWVDGSTAAAMSGVFCALFATMDDPSPAIISFGIYSTLSIPIAAVFLFAVLPAIDGFVMLTAVLAVPLLLGGYFMVKPKTALPALALVIFFSGSLALHDQFSADFSSFINSNLAQNIALLIAVVITRSLRTLSVEMSAKRLLKSTWRIIATVARGNRRTPHPFDIAAQMIDRLGLLTPRLALTEETLGVTSSDALMDLRTGLTLALVQQQREPDSESSIALDRVLHQVGDHFAALRAGRASAPDASLLHSLDHALSLAAARPNRIEVAALVGLRRTLFAKAPAYSLEPSS